MPDPIQSAPVELCRAIVGGRSGDEGGTLSYCGLGPLVGLHDPDYREAFAGWHPFVPAPVEPRCCDGIPFAGGHTHAINCPRVSLAPVEEAEGPQDDGVYYRKGVAVCGVCEGRFTSYSDYQSHECERQPPDGEGEARSVEVARAAVRGEHDADEEGTYWTVEAGSYFVHDAIEAAIRADVEARPGLERDEWGEWHDIVLESDYADAMRKVKRYSAALRRLRDNVDWVCVCHQRDPQDEHNPLGHELRCTTFIAADALTTHLDAAALAALDAEGNQEG